MTKIEIKRGFTGAVLFAHEAEGNTIAVTLQAAVEARANLAGANLARANLARANLARANLAGANLAGANLARANLAGANLADANLAGANLAGANLARANLAGGAKVAAGHRAVLQVGPIGSRNAVLVVYRTDQGLRFDTGCQRQIDRETFERRLRETHGDGPHGQEYRAALTFIDALGEIWK